MRFSLIILLSFFSLSVFAQEKPIYDSSQVEQRNFSASSLSAYSKNPDFQYEKESIKKPSWWDRFWEWFWHLIDEIMSTPAGRITMQVLYWALGLGVLAFFIMKLTKMNKVNLFTASPGNKVPYSIEEENIHAIQFDEAINNALQNGNYRLAIRLLYLQNLKLLTDKKIIAWQINKTNRDYLREINKPNLQQLFKRITDVFEYAWYGHFTVNREDFAELKENLSKFQSQL